MYDIVIIGAGVVGSAIARELSRYQLKIAVLERFEDVAMGTTKANSGIVHRGFDAKPGTLKAKLNAQGNLMFDQLSKELDFSFRRNGAMVICFEEKELPALEALFERGKQNRISDISIVNKEEILEQEPNINPSVLKAIYAPNSGIVGPYEMNLALAENASQNGVEFFLLQEVININKNDNIFEIMTTDSCFKSKILINAAGVYADNIHNMISKQTVEIIPRSGQYVLFDRAVGDLVNNTLFQLPNKNGKGVLVTPTIDGNLLIGPTAADVVDKENLSTTSADFDQLISSAEKTLREIPMKHIITSFKGLRAHDSNDDFIIEQVEDVQNMIDVRGIESPGLTASPAIGIFVKNLVGERIKLEANSNFNPIRRGIKHFSKLNEQEQNKLIRADSRYGKIICRCETVTEGEIVDAINRPLGARDLDGVKRRTRAGMGRCQGGFCSPLVLDILARELKVSPLEITKFGGGSKILLGYNKN